MSRLKILCALFVVGALIVGANFIWGDYSSFWSEAFSQPPKRPVKIRTTRQTVTTKQSVTPHTTLLSELPRQALFITGAYSYGLPACDRSVDFAGAADEKQLVCRVTWELSPRATRAIVSDAAGTELQSIDLAVPVLDEQHPDYAKVAAIIESWCDTQFVPLLARTGRAAKPLAADSTLETPPEIENLLAQIDPQRAFLAAHLLHETITASGESPQRLAALVRAYSHLGESTRYLYSRHGSVFFARAMIYAERLARKHPDLPISHAARGYAYTLLGQPMEGRRAFAKARELAGENGALPSWAILADDLNHFRTRQLFDRANRGKDVPIARYFALLTVEHSRMPTLVINLARAALQSNPGALRVINIMTDNSGVSLQHTTTAQATQAQFDLLATLAGERGVPASLQSKVQDAVKQKFAAPALLDCFAEMDIAPSSPGQLLPWGTYASISRDALFVSGFRRLYFTQKMLALNPGERLQSWWPILKDHRFSPIIGGFDNTGKLADLKTISRIRNIDYLDIYGRMSWMCEYVKKLDPPSGKPKRDWIENYDYNSDDTAYDLSQLLWSYSGKEADAIPFLAVTKGLVAKSLAVLSPENPSAMADLIVNRWNDMRPRAAEIERDTGGHPQVAFALARAYRFEGRYADALRLLEQIIQIAPDVQIYEELAEVYKQQGDADKWLDIYDKYLAGGEEFGLEKARKSEEIAYTLMGMKKPDKALPYAKAAADSYSGWGLRVYAMCLTEIGRFDEAEQIAKATQERYPASLTWYRWCQMTGTGDLQSARAMSEKQVAKSETSPDEGERNDVAVYLQLEGKIDRARACWEDRAKRRRDPYAVLQLVMLDLEQGKTEEAQTRLDDGWNRDIMLNLPGLEKLAGGQITLPDETRDKVYGVAFSEVQRCMNDPNAVPARDGEIKMILDANATPYRGCAAYFFGRLCEIRGKKEDAIWWYRASLDTLEWTFSCRPQSAAGLRRLGDEYYKKIPRAPQPHQRAAPVAFNQHHKGES